MSGDVLSVVESAYVASVDADAWLRGALEAVHPHLDRGTGVFAHRFTLQSDAFWRGPMQAVGADRGEAAIVERAPVQVLEGMPRREAMGLLRKVYPLAPAVVRLSDLADAATVAQATSLIPRRVGDSTAVVAADPCGHGCIFFRLDAKAARVPRRTAAIWQRVAAHLVAGYRLARERETRVDAVLDPGGRLLHREDSVTRDASGALSDAARSIDRARGRLRRVDPDRALDLWKSMVDGRWSLVDQFDHDGRRFVVAKRNVLRPRPWQSLSERESQILAYIAQGQSPKMIAYQLGVSTATLSGDLSRAARKVGARSRIELVTAYRAQLEGGAA